MPRIKSISAELSPDSEFLFWCLSQTGAAGDVIEPSEEWRHDFELMLIDIRSSILAILVISSRRQTFDQLVPVVKWDAYQLPIYTAVSNTRSNLTAEWPIQCKFSSSKACM